LFPLVNQEAGGAENSLKALRNDRDERLQVEAARQDPAQFADLYEDNFERVYAYIARRVGNREEAQDLTAEVFHQALASLPGFEWRGLPFAAWLLGIAANVLSGRWRRVIGQMEVATEDVGEAGIEDRVEQRAMLYQLVDRLPPHQRYVIMRRFLGQKSLREIATELGRSEGAIKQLQLRALQNLRGWMRSNHG
jgi:RNA polymerase sigma-70 factor, ECF subfamily